MHSYDILIVGGGLVGASLVRALQGRGLRIAVVEAVQFETRTEAGYDDRASRPGVHCRERSSEPVRRLRRRPRTARNASSTAWIYGAIWRMTPHRSTISMCPIAGIAVLPVWTVRRRD